MNHISIARTGYVLAAATLLAAASSCEKKFSPESLVGEPWHTILNIKNNGEQSVSIKAKNPETVWSMVVLKTGSEKNAAGSARLRVMTADELELLFPENTYEILDGDCYDFDREITFAADESGKQIDVHLKSKEILDQMESDASRTFVLPLELVSSSDSVNANRNYSLLSFVDGAKPHKDRSHGTRP